MMNNSEELIKRITDFLDGLDISAETKRFGGAEYFMKNGKVICSVFGSNLLVKCKPEALEEILKNEHTSTVPGADGNPQSDMFYLKPEGIENDGVLKNWLMYGVEYTSIK